MGKVSIGFFHPASLISTVLGLGRIPKAPGTLASAVTVLIVWLSFVIPDYIIKKEEISGILKIVMLLTSNIIFFTAFPPYNIVTIVIIYIIGWYATSVYVKKTIVHDPKEIVIDEVAGQLLAIMIVMPLIPSPVFQEITIHYTLAIIFFCAFVFFRIFDISKISLIGWFDKKFHNAHGVMLDDIAAGIYAGFSCYIVHYIAYYFFVR